MNLKIEYIDKNELKAYANNAKIHTAEQVEQIKKSIQEFSFNDPIAVWKDNEIIEGHGRLMAVLEMDDITEVPIIRLDNLTDEQRRAYMLVHNKLTMNTDFDVDILDIELEGLPDFDAEFYDFDLKIEDDSKDSCGDNHYTDKVNVPQYEPSGEVEIADCFDNNKYMNLVDKIQQAEISIQEKEFLLMAATRHIVFKYNKIADYYASKASPKMQELMEESALVIIDFEDAIKNGYAKLSEEIAQMYVEDE